MIDGFSDRRKDPAYRNGWGDGRFGLMETFLENPNLSRWERHPERLADHRRVRGGLRETVPATPNPPRWESHPERLAYYRGHREGRRIRETLSHKDPA